MSAIRSRQRVVTPEARFGFEMLGLNLFLLALLDHLAQKGWAVRFTSGKAPEPASAP